MTDPLPREAQRYADHVNPAFVRLLGTFGYGRIFVRARGLELWDAEERRYLDFLAGFGTNCLGHNPAAVHERLVEALGASLPNVMHVGPEIAAGELGEALARLVPALPIAMFSLSGGEAVEAAMKLARAATGRPGIVYAGGGFHGTGLGNLSVMGHARWQRPFQPLLPECHAVPFGDLEALAHTLKEHKVGGVLLEPIQGEAGVIMPPEGYLLAVQALCRETGALFMLDEVQTGLGRTGKWFAYQHTAGLDPDVLILGKGLGAGVIPISATLTRRDLHQRAYGSMWKFDLHGSTYAGNALGCITALAVLRAIEEGELVEAAGARGRYLASRLGARLAGHPLLKAIRGPGLLVGIELGPQGKGVLGKLFAAGAEAISRQVLGQWLSLRLLERGFVCQPASQEWNVLKLTPPLVVGESDIDAFVATVGDILGEYTSLVPLLRDVSRRLGSQFLSGWQFG
jgi:putrescine aminotransferase